MALTLYVDGDRWRTHLKDVLARHPGLVPVAKGNGYGFGLARLARKAEWLGVDTLAVGTYDELGEVSQRYPGSLLVLTPWRPFSTASDDPRVIHTVGRLEDLQALAEHGPVERSRPRVALERMTSMLRHGFTAKGLREAGRFRRRGRWRRGRGRRAAPAPGQDLPPQRGRAADERRRRGRDRQARRRRSPGQPHGLGLTPDRGRARHARDGGSPTSPSAPHRHLALAR